MKNIFKRLRRQKKVQRTIKRNHTTSKNRLLTKGTMKSIHFWERKSSDLEIRTQFNRDLYFKILDYRHEVSS